MDEPEWMHSAYANYLAGLSIQGLKSLSTCAWKAADCADDKNCVT